MRACAAVPVVLLLAAPAAARGEIVAHLSNESEIRAYGGVAAVSELNPDTRRYRLMRVHRDGRVVPLPGVPSRARPFDADVGPDSDGRPVVAYSRGGDLFLHRLGRRHARVLRRVGFGMSGTEIVGPTFAGHRLGWLVACFGDPSGCSRGPSTFDLRTGRTTTERGYRPRTGYAFVRGGTLEVGGGGSELGDDPYEGHEEPGYLNPCATDDETATCPVIYRRR